MSKTYVTPQIASKGDAVKLTLGVPVLEATDTDEITKLAPIGSMGFSL